MTKNERNKWFRLRQKLGWCPNDEKPNEQRINRDRTWDGVQMMRNQRNKKET